MKKLLIVAVLLSACCAFCLDGAIEFPERGFARGDALNFNFALCADASTVASHSASLATLSADVITRANVTGSTGTDFGCATLTWSNMTNNNYAVGYLTASRTVLANKMSIVVYDTASPNPSGAMSGATFTVPVSGLYRSSACVGFFQDPADPGSSTTRQASIVVNGSTVANSVAEFTAGMSAYVSTVHVQSPCMSLKQGDTITVMGGSYDPARTSYLFYADFPYRNWFCVEQVR